MNLRKYLYFLIFPVLAAIIALSVRTVAVCADEGTDGAYSGTTYSLDSGISLVIPDEYAFYATWNQATEDSTGWVNMGCFASLDGMLSTIKKDGIEFISYRDDISMERGYFFYVTFENAPDELTNEALFKLFSEDALAPNGINEDSPVLGYGTVEINGLTFFKIYVENGNGDSNYVYMLATDDGLIHQIYTENHCFTDEPDYLDSLAYNVITTATFSPELSAKTIKLTGDSFHMINGVHKAAFSDVNATAPSSGTASKTSDTGKSSSEAAAPKKSFYQRFVSFEFPTWIILIALAAILFVGVRFSKKGEWQENALSLDTSKGIQGFCAVAIIIHHLAQDLTSKAGVLSVFSDFGVLFVGVFFFFSGYGLFTSLKSKENYLKGFLKKRLVTILIPFYVCILVFIVSACLRGESFPIPDLIAVITGWILINSHMWYIVEIAVLYLAFFVIYRLIKNRRTATIVMSLFVAALTVGSLLLKHGADMSSRFWFMGEWWYNTTFAFILGIVVSQNFEKLQAFARRFYWVLLPVFTALTVAFGFLTKYALNNWSYWNEYPGYSGYKEKFLCLIVQLPWVLFFVITLLLIMMKVRFGNPVLRFLGSISLELYLIHNLFLTGLKDGSIMTIRSNSLYIALTLLLSIGLATIISGFDKYVIALINGKSGKSGNGTDSSSGTAPQALEKAPGRIHSIDVMRIVMAFLVVTIHVPFKGTAGNVFITYGKTAVPFFLTVCGYFLYRADSAAMMARLKKQTLRMMIFYVGGNFLYALAMLLSARLDGYSLRYTGKQYLDLLLYNMSPFSEHLWFLGSLLYALLILMLLTQLKALDYAMFAAPALIAAYVVLSHLNVADAYVLRNALLVGLPYTMMGMLIRRYQDKLTKIKAPVLWIPALVLSVTAILELFTYKAGVGVPFISCEILVYVIVLLCLKYPDFGRDTFAEWMGAELSPPIYILHILPVLFLGYVIPSNVGILSNYGAITVFVVTALIAALYKAVKRAIVKQK